MPSSRAKTDDTGAFSKWSAPRVRVYDADQKLPPVGPYLRDTVTHLRFALEKARYDLKAAHKDTWFGRLWNVMNPLLLGLVYSLLVLVIFGGGGSPFDREGLRVLTIILGGLFLFGLPSGGMSLGARSIVGGGAFILNTRLPRMILPIGSVISAFLSFAPSLIVYALFHLVAGFPVGFHLLWAAPIIAILFVISVGFAMVLATLNVYFRDVASFLPYVVRIWMYLTPVIYLHDRVPNAIRWSLAVNPLGAAFTAWQQVLFEGTAPDLRTLGTAVLWALAVLVVGAYMFMRREREFAVRI